MGYVWRQLGFFIAALWLAATFTFFLPQLLGRVPIAGSLPSDYVTYLWRLAHFDLGRSLMDPYGSVNATIGAALPWTILLIGSGTILAAVLGILLGILMAWHRGGLLDTVLTPTAMFGTSLPYYVVAIMLLYLLGVVGGWLPVAGPYGYQSAPNLSPGFIGDVIDHAILPVLSIAITTIGSWLLPMRNAMVETLHEDFMTLAEGKGLGARRIMLAYAARNAVLPTLTNLAVQLGFVVGGAVLIETLFDYPGVGLLLVNAVYAGNYPLIQGIILLGAGTALAANFLANVLYVRLDPRLREIGMRW